MVVLSGLVPRGVVERVERLSYPLVVVDVVAGTTCVVAITRAGHAAETIILPDVATLLDLAEITANTLATILDTSCGISELLAAFETERDGHLAGGVVHCILPEPLQKIGVGIVEDTALVLPVIRKILVLDFRNGPDREVTIRVDGKAVASTTHLGSIASAGHVAV